MVDEGCRDSVCEGYSKLIRAPLNISREQVLTADHCPGGGTQGKGPTVGWQESDSISERYRERGQVHASRARVPLQGERAMPRGGYQKYVGDTSENLIAIVPATDLFQGNSPTRRSTIERDVRGGGRGRGRVFESVRGGGEDDGGMLWTRYTRGPTNHGGAAEGGFGELPRGGSIMSVGDGPMTRDSWEEMYGWEVETRNCASSEEASPQEDPDYSVKKIVHVKMVQCKWYNVNGTMYNVQLYNVNCTHPSRCSGVM